MPRPCDTCRSARVREIDAELRLKPRASIATIAERYGVDQDALERHFHNHVLLEVPYHKRRLRPVPVADEAVRDRSTASIGAADPRPPEPMPPLIAEAESELNQLADWSEVPQVSAAPHAPSQPTPVEPPKLAPPQQKTRFLEVLSEYGSPNRACKDVGIPRSRVHTWLEKDELFSFAYHQALAAATEGLEEVARERATRGARIEKQIWRQGRLVETVVEYRPSDTALITLLKAQKPDTYRERLDQNVSGEVQVRYTNDWRSAPARPDAVAN